VKLLKNEIGTYPEVNWNASSVSFTAPFAPIVS
jgi:hypothetical protein